MLDAGSFLELGTFVEHRGGRLMQGVEAPGEGVVTGSGTIDGRQVFVFSQDFTVLGGSLGQDARRQDYQGHGSGGPHGCPVIGLNDSAGARIQEGVDSLSGYGEIFYRNAVYSGAVPQISAILGPCAGGAVYSPALTDFILMSGGSSYMFITGPEVIKSVTREDVTFEQLGGADVHTRKSGVAHLEYDGDEAVLRGIRDLLGYLPQNAREKAPVHPTSDPVSRRNDALLKIVTPDQRRPYAMHDVIHELVDDGTFLEIQPNWAKNILVGFARLDGQSVGIVANNPRVMAGTLNIDASDKAARFIRTCDCYNIPILTLVDVTGFLPGVAQEHARHHPARREDALCLRRSHRAQNHADHAQKLRRRVPRHEQPRYGRRRGVRVAHRCRGRDGRGGSRQHRVPPRHPEAENPEAMRAEKIRDYKDAFDNPYVAASKGYIDDVIPMEDTRARLIQTFAMLREKREERPYKKHGNMPL